MCGNVDVSQSLMLMNVFSTYREMSDEKRLINKLLGEYSRIGKGGRPVRNSSAAVPVLFGLGLIQMDLHEKAKILSMSMWTRYVSTQYDYKNG